MTNTPATHATATEKTIENPNIKVVTLDEPIKRGETEIKELILRKPKSGELRGLTLLDLMQMDVKAVHKILPRISQPSLIEAEINQMDPADIAQCAIEIANFFLTREQKMASLAA